MSQRRIFTPVQLIAGLVMITMAAFGLRVIGLAEVPPRWDEGWSIALSSLSLPEIFTITSADVHPPLYYLLLSLWQNAVGINLFAARYLAVLMSLPSIPLAFSTAQVWSSDSRGRSAAIRPALLAALLLSWLPLSVYYGAVVRMYALAPTFVLLAAWSALKMSGRAERAPGVRTNAIYLLAFVISATGAMLTLYHAIWALAALSGYYLLVSLAAGRKVLLRRLGLYMCAVALAILAYSPWAIYAIPQLLQRAAGGAVNVGQQYPLGYFIRLGMEDLTMPQVTGLAGPIYIGILCVVGLLCALLNIRARNRNGNQEWRKPYRPWLEAILPLLLIALTLLGVAAAARSWAFNARMLICAAPGLALLLAWSLDQIAARTRLLAALAGVGLIGLYFTTSTQFVYQKTLEVFDPYNPHTYLQHLSPDARSDDIVFFNVLSPAGFYALDRNHAVPEWSYALTWDPVIEPADRWQARITTSMTVHQRLWIVLYRGLAGKNGDLRGWLDTNLYPANAQWGEEEVFYGLYGSAHQPMAGGSSAGTHWLAGDGFDLELRSSELAASIHAGDIVPIGFTWQAGVKLKQSYKIFVHALDDRGNLVAQHDAMPVNDLRPTTSFPVGIDIVDHHGLALPASFQGRLRIEMGLYDPQTGARLKTSQGQDAVLIGTVDVSAN